MLIRFGVRNHLSLKNEESITLTKSSLKDTEIGLISVPAYPQVPLLPCAIIYGANASGKSNFVAALNMMKSHVINSHVKGTPGGGVPQRSFALSKKEDASTSRFELDFICASLRYNYGYENDGNSFTSEWLYSFPQGRRQRLYEREGSKMSFGRSFKGQNKIIEGLMRENSLFLSCAAQNDHEEAIKVYSYIRDIYIGSHISVPGEEVKAHIKKGDVDKRVISFLERIRTGVVDYRKREESISPESKAFSKGLSDLIKNVLDLDIPLNSADEINMYLIQLGHRGEGKKLRYFDLDRESAGTRRLLVLLGPIFSALDSGSVVMIDELDASLHTQAVEALIVLFSTKSTNPNGAQLIATVHDTNVLRSKYLRRDQVWFTEKNDVGVTNLYPLTDIETKKNDNIEKGYLENRYGATAFSDDIRTVIESL